jgi:hypothetical protein
MIAILLIFLLHCARVDAQQLPWTRGLQGTSKLSSSVDYKRNLMKTTEDIRSHPFARALHGLNQDEQNAAINQLRQVVNTLNGSVSSFCNEDLDYFVTSIENYAMAMLENGNGSAEVKKETEFALRREYRVHRFFAEKSRTRPGPGNFVKKMPGPGPADQDQERRKSSRALKFSTLAVSHITKSRYRPSIRLISKSKIAQN